MEEIFLKIFKAVEPNIAVRPRGQKPKFGVKVQDFIKQIKEEIEKKATTQPLSLG